MRTVRLELPNTTKVGTRDDYRSLQEDTLYLVSAKDEAKLPAFAERTVAPEIAQSFLTNQGRFAVGDLVRTRLQVDSDAASEETKYLSKLLDEVNADLGSIEITGATAHLSWRGGVLVELRIEAEEGGKRRVVFIGDNTYPLVNLTARQVVQTVDAKF